MFGSFLQTGVALLVALFFLIGAISPVSFLPGALTTRLLAQKLKLDAGFGRLAADQRGMLFQRINRQDAETVFAIFYNVAGATITANYAAVWDTGTSDGIRVTKPATATLSLFVGLANKDLADSSYGLFQNYGYRASGFTTNDTSQAIAAGDILIPVNAQHYLVRSAASDGKSGFVYAGQSFATATTPAAANKSVFIRGL